MKKYHLNKSAIHEGNLILVNQKYPLKSPIAPTSLASFNDKYQHILINQSVGSLINTILKELNAKDQIVPVSGYRTFEEQQSIFIDSLNIEGLDFTLKYVAFPNSSEHQTGLAIDLGLNEEPIDFIRPKFPHTGICETFRLASLKYGFIERYQKDKQSITGISAEEWHFRYVGYPHSLVMQQYNFCLEEYHAYLKKHSITYKNYHISYLPYQNEDQTIILDDHDQISGNNIDGFIVTKLISKEDV